MAIKDFVPLPGKLPLFKMINLISNGIKQSIQSELQNGPSKDILCTKSKALTHKEILRFKEDIIISSL